jgi:glycyl-tRNA synthetase
MIRNIKDAWWDNFVRRVPDIHGIDGAIIQNSKLWEASGHVAGFNDPLVDCRNCNARHRADHIANKDTSDHKELTELIKDKACSNCGKKGQFTEVRDFNMMFKTAVGPAESSGLTSLNSSIQHIEQIVVDATEDKAEIFKKIKSLPVDQQAKAFEEYLKRDIESAGAISAEIAQSRKAFGEQQGSTVYLRPETAGSIFTNFELVRETTRAKLPFGIAQIGKAFRNEIRARDFVFRVREFEQMEIEYFVHPDRAEAELAAARKDCFDWLLSIGLSEENLRWHQHGEDERAHYAADSWDIQYNYSFGFKELWGVANRTDYDLKAHAEASGKKLNYFDPDSNEHIVPFVIEPSVGVSRLFMALLSDAYTEEEVNGEKRVVLKLNRGIAPIDIAVLPLSKKPELSEVSKRVYRLLSDNGYAVEYDESQSIGKRYRRQDEIGTPSCVTVDFDTLEDDSVTVRDRDTMSQVRIKISSLKEYFERQL